MTSSSAGLERSEDPLATRALTHAHTRSSKDRENVENVIRTMRHGAYPHPTPRAVRFSLSLSCFTNASPFLSHNPHSYLEHFTSFLSCCVWRFTIICFQNVVLNWNEMYSQPVLTIFWIRCFKLVSTYIATQSINFRDAHLFFYYPK